MHKPVKSSGYRSEHSSYSLRSTFVRSKNQCVFLGISASRHLSCDRLEDSHCDSRCFLKRSSLNTIGRRFSAEVVRDAKTAGVKRSFKPSKSLLISISKPHNLVFVDDKLCRIRERLNQIGRNLA